MGHWIPGYTEIGRKETADKLAKIGSQLNISSEEKLDKEVFYPEVKKIIHEEFVEQWKKSNRITH